MSQFLGYRYNYIEVVPEIPEGFGLSWLHPKSIKNKDLPIWVRGNRCVHIYVPDYVTTKDEWHLEREELKGTKIRIYRAICNHASWISDIHEPIAEIKPGTEILNNPDINRPFGPNFVTGVCSKCSGYLDNFLGSRR